MLIPLSWLSGLPRYWVKLPLGVSRCHRALDHLWHGVHLASVGPHAIDVASGLDAVLRTVAGVYLTGEKDAGIRILFSWRTGLTGVLGGQ